MKNAGVRGRISLWLLAVPVASWGLHFLAVYVIAAIYCAKAGSGAAAAEGPLWTVRWWVIAVTGLTLLVYALAARRGYAGLRANGSSGERDQGFLGAVALMLCALSAAASLFLASVPFFFADCRP